MKIKSLFITIACGVATLVAFSQNNIIEEVAWMVGDQPIYKSEIEEMYQQMLYEGAPINGDPYCVVPEQIAIQKLFLHQADIDTVEVSESMVQMEAEAYINALITNIGSKEKVEQYFRKPVPEIRQQLVESTRDNERVRQVKMNLTSDVKTTPSDVRRYFNTLSPDSVPFVPLQVEVQIMTLNPIIPRQEIDDVKARLRDFADRITKGESDMYTLAVIYSEDPASSMRGGETGFLGRASMDPEYAAVAFNLNDTKKVSKIVESQYGFHIIQLIEKRGDRINTRHILLRPRVSQTDLDRSLERLDSIRTDIIKGDFTFEEATPFLSQDKDTRNNRGVMVNEDGTTLFKMSDLPQEVAHVVDTLEVGAISRPFVMKDPKRDRDIVAMVKLTSRMAPHKANIGDDYQMIKNMYEDAERSRMLNEWLGKKIKETYIKIEDGWDNCEFQHAEWLKIRK